MKNEAEGGARVGCRAVPRGVVSTGTATLGRAAVPGPVPRLFCHQDPTFRFFGMFVSPDAVVHAVFERITNDTRLAPFLFPRVVTELARADIT